MSRPVALSEAVKASRQRFNADDFVPMVENHPTRHGIMRMLSPRRKVQMWSDSVTHKGDLWLSDSLLTEELRKTIEEVATISDSPWLKSEKKIVLKDDTHNNRVRLFKTICKSVGL